MAADPQDPILSGMNPAEIDAVFRQSAGAKSRSAVPQAANEEPSIEDFNPLSVDKAFRQAAAQPATPKVKSIFKRAISGAEDVLRTAGQGAAAAADIPFETIPALIETTTYPAARALGQTPEQAQRTAGRVAGTAASYFAQPFGKAFGVTETPGYKGMGFAEFVAKYADKGANWISQQTGAPAEDVKNVMAQLGFVAGGPAGEVAGAAGRAVGGALKREAGYVAGAARDAVSGFKADRAVKENKIPTEMQAQFDAQRSMGAAQAQPNPWKTVFSGAEEVKGEYPKIRSATISKPRNVAEQQAVRELLTDVLGDNVGALREGVVTGDIGKLKDEYHLLKRPEDSPEGAVMKSQIAKEQEALTNYGRQRIEATGADPLLQNAEERGSRIYDLFTGETDSIRGWLNQQKNELYADARDKVGSNPVTGNNIGDTIKDDVFTATAEATKNKELVSGVEKLINLAKTKGFKDKGRIIQPNTIDAWEFVRQRLNTLRNETNKGLIKDLNGAIDLDIAEAAGGDFLPRARRLHEIEKTIFGEKGIKRAFSKLSENGVETGVPFEKIPQHLNSLPVGEWKHIVDTAEMLARGKFVDPIGNKKGQPRFTLDIPPEVQQNAKRALAEIRGSLAREAFEKGASTENWNARAYNEILNARGPKISYGFPLDQQQAFHRLNLAGQLMPAKFEYEGAAIQTARESRVQKGLELARKAAQVGVPAAGAGAGAFIGTAFEAPGFGAGLGAIASQQLKSSVEGAMAAKAAQNMTKRMQEQFQKGRTPINQMIPPQQ